MRNVVNVMMVVAVIALAMVISPIADAAQPLGRRQYFSFPGIGKTIVTEISGTTETIIGQCPVGNVANLSVVATSTSTDSSTLTSTLKVYVAEGAVTAVSAAYDAHTLGTESAPGTWDYDMSDMEPGAYIVVTSTVSTGAAVPCTYTLHFRGIRYGK